MYMVDDGRLQSELLFSDSTKARTMKAPRRPEPAEVTENNSTFLVVKLSNPGVVSDPKGTALELDCNGRVFHVPVTVPTATFVSHKIDGLRETVSYSIRYRCLVGDAVIDRSSPWSATLRVNTLSAMEVRLATMEARLVSARAVMRVCV